MRVDISQERLSFGKSTKLAQNILLTSPYCSSCAAGFEYGWMQIAA